MRSPVSVRSRVRAHFGSRIPFVYRSGKPIPKINGVAACIDDSNAIQFDKDQNTTIVNSQNYTNYCVCKKGYSGKNCGGRSSSNSFDNHVLVYLLTTRPVMHT